MAAPQHAQQYSPLELTAVHAIACKSSAHRRGYAQESQGQGQGQDYKIVASGAAAPRCPKKNYQTPLLNRMYYCRVVAIRAMLGVAVDAIGRELTLSLSAGAATPGPGSSRNIQLLVLGAGFELFDDLPEHVTVFLVDLPGITAARREADRDREGAGPGRGRGGIRLVAADLRDTAQLLTNLASAGFETALPSIVLLESVLSYIGDAHVNSLLQCLRSSIPWVNLLVYDVTLPKARGGFAQYTQKSFERGKAPLLSARASPLEFALNLRSTGWPHVCSCTVQQALTLFVSPDRARMPMALEPFDEFAALAVLNKQYIVAFAGNNFHQFQSMLCIPSQIYCPSSLDAEVSTHTTADQSDCAGAESPVLPTPTTSTHPPTTPTVSAADRLRVLQVRIDLLLTRVLSVQLARAAGGQRRQQEDINNILV
jgi:hypothetical protein